jgi:hypothetical protein
MSWSDRLVGCDGPGKVKVKGVVVGNVSLDSVVEHLEGCYVENSWRAELRQRIGLLIYMRSEARVTRE